MHQNANSPLKHTLSQRRMYNCITYNFKSGEARGINVGGSFGNDSRHDQANVRSHHFAVNGPHCRSKTPFSGSLFMAGSVTEAAEHTSTLRHCALLHLLCVYYRKGEVVLDWGYSKCTYKVYIRPYASSKAPAGRFRRSSATQRPLQDSVLRQV